jgi:hypothetical protein
MEYRREGCSPENHQWKEPRASIVPQAMVRQTTRRVCRTHPGSQTSPSLTLRTYGNHGDPGESAEGVAQLPTSLNSEEEAGNARKSESPKVAMKSGNADGAKGWQYWDSESMANMPRHRADSAHDH